LYGVPPAGEPFDLLDKRRFPCSPLPSPEEMKEIAMEAGPTEGDLLRTVLLRFVLEPWVTAKVERTCGEVATGLFEQLSYIINSSYSSLTQMLDHADATEKAKVDAQTEFEAAEKEFLRAQARLEELNR
jgi:hypothetical protein